MNPTKPKTRLKSPSSLSLTAIGFCYFAILLAIRGPSNSGSSIAVAAPVADAVPSASQTALPTVGAIVPVVSNTLPEMSYTGIIVSADPKERVLTVKGGKFSEKTFNFGDNCVFTFLYSMMENNDGAMNDLRPGEKVKIGYQKYHGVLIADRLEQQPMAYTGGVAKVDVGNHTLVLHRGGGERQLAVANDCIVVLANDKPGTLADIHPNDRVTVTYETPKGQPTAWQITKDSVVSAAR